MIRLKSCLSSQTKPDRLYIPELKKYVGLYTQAEYFQHFKN
jgi:hypothetical protein